MSVPAAVGNGTLMSPLVSADASAQEVLRRAQEELRGLLQQRADLMKRIGTLRQTITGMATLFGDEILSQELLQLVNRKPSGRQSGFTHACRVLLMEARHPLAVREVCSRMRERMPAVLERHKDPLASLTTVLNRLVEYGEAQSMRNEQGRRAWMWVVDDGKESIPGHPIAGRQ